MTTMVFSDQSPLVRREAGNSYTSPVFIAIYKAALQFKLRFINVSVSNKASGMNSRAAKSSASTGKVFCIMKTPDYQS